VSPASPSRSRPRKAAGALDPTADPAQIAFELNAYMVLGNMQFVAMSDPAPLARVRRAVDARLGALAVRDRPMQT
jgi:hypothetical protein